MADSISMKALTSILIAHLSPFLGEINKCKCHIINSDPKWYINLSKHHCSFFPRTARDWNQLVPDMPDITSLVEFKNYMYFSSLAQ